MKAGTTSFFTWLCAHPRIVPPRRKEIHFFDARYDRGLAWYRRCFPPIWSTPAGAVTGEATPKYLYHPDVPGRVARDLPGVRAIALLRDPVARALSHYHHAVRTGRERRPFAQAVGEEIEALRRAEGRAPFPPLARRAYVGRGIYAPQLRRWFDALGRERVLVLDAGAFFERPAEELERALDFLGLAHSPAVRRAALGSPRNRHSYPPEDPAVLAALRAFFEPWDEELGSLLGRPAPWRRHETDAQFPPR